MEKTKRTPKRVLKNIDFESSTESHIALVHKDQGGPASGADYKLVIKNRNFSEDFLEKASRVRITMDLEEFLVRFYQLTYSDSEILARALGFDTAEEDEKEDEGKSYQQEYEDYIQSKVDAIEILKSLSEADSIPEVLSKLSEEEYLSMLQSQAKLEKAFKKVEQLKKKSDKSVPADESETSTNASVENNVEPTGSETTKKEIEKMTEKTVEMVEKSTLESIQKAFDEQKVALEKALETVKQFEAEKKEAIQKARKQEMLTAVKDADKVEVLFKAVAEADDETFAAVVKTLADMQVAVEKSKLFEEQGANTQDNEVKVSPVEKLLKSKFAK